MHLGETRFTYGSAATEAAIRPGTRKLAPKKTPKNVSSTSLKACWCLPAPASDARSAANRSKRAS